MNRDFERVKPQLAVSDDGVRVFSSGMNELTVQYPNRKVRFGCTPVEDEDGFLELISDLIEGRTWENLDGSKASEMTNVEREQARIDLEGGLSALGSRWIYRDEPLPFD